MIAMRNSKGLHGAATQLFSQGIERMKEKIAMNAPTTIFAVGDGALM
jgi:hypothetical protein